MRVFILRHGETAWSKSGQHTGLTDIPLTENGIKQAKSLKKAIQGIHFEHIFSSPLQRALRTCQICGHKNPILLDELLEWDYGEYEGKTKPAIQKIRPKWNIFAHGAPKGESPKDIIKRFNCLMKKLKLLKGNIALFSSGHISRAIASLWIQQPLILGSHLLFSTGAYSILGHDRNSPVIILWNETKHLF